MSQAKLLAGACAVALAAVALSTVAVRAAAQDKPAEPAPLWAFPGNQPAKPFDAKEIVTLPGSSEKLTLGQIKDRTTAVDWFPKGHPAMPPAVKGNPSNKGFACGFCHLPEGTGRTESADVAGMPADYLYRQLLDMKSGARKSMDSHYGPQANMILTAKAWSDADLRAAADYFAKIKYPSNHVKVIEAAEVPAHKANAFVYEFEKDGPKEAIGERIIEGPDDFERFEQRDWRVGMTAYVPPGAIARGAALAKGDSVKGIPACDTCHGAGLKGGAVAPPIAGRYPTGIFRQLYAFKIGSRDSLAAGFMKPMVANLSQKDMIDLAAYVGSLKN
jgi:cytochrome c553